MKYTSTRGRRGEDAAIKFLIGKGFCVLGRNFRTPWGEIDIIARDRDEVIFVEVKTRISDSFGLGEDAMNFKKILRLSRAIRIYLEEHLSVRKFRIDFISVLLDENGKILHIEHIEDIETS